MTLHEYFYVSDAPIQFYVKFNYRMGGNLSDLVRVPKAKVEYKAIQSLIYPEDINPDDKYKFSR
jgi:hypothetical protein